jgi:hypothetical protein
MKAQFLEYARAQITGTDEGLHIKDPKGDELYLRFLADVLPRRERKSAASLFNPESPDYLHFRAWGIVQFVRVLRGSEPRPRRSLSAGHSHTLSQPRRRLRLHPIESFAAGLKLFDRLNRAIGPFGLHLPMLAVF